MSILLSKAVSGQCRWIVCDAVEGSRDPFGGRRVCGGGTSWPTSYCLRHRLAVYQRTGDVAQPPQEFATRAASPAPDTIPDLTEIFG